MDTRDSTHSAKIADEKQGISAGQADNQSRASSSAQELGSRRQEKILEHLAATLESSDTLQACLGPVACDLLEMLHGLKKGINTAFATGPMALERFENLRATIEMYARLAGLAYKLANLEHRIKEGNEAR